MRGKERYCAEEKAELLFLTVCGVYFGIHTLIWVVK